MKHYPIYDQYNNYFLSFTTKKIYDSHINKSTIVHEVLNDFWIIILSKKGEIICRYVAENNASLRIYLSAILFNHIKSINRKIKREREIFKDNKNKEDSNAYNELTEDDFKYFKATEEDSDDDNELTENNFNCYNKVELIHEALSLLSQESPTDAKYIRMHLLEGFTYEKIAKKELPHEKDEKVIKRKIDAIKKQVTRDRTGSKAKFKKILQELKESERLNTRYALV